ncbi:hypothetical protein [Bacillus muralis]|uniref:hypothetical protein n=1 Tax=Peribacillus muralis TaxID=264697 RepID=UPI0007DB0B8E
MKNKFHWLLTVVGSGLLIMGIVIELTQPKEIITAFIRPDLVSIGVLFSGVILAFIGFTEILDAKRKTKLQQIEENDERNIKMNEYAKSKAFDFMSSLFGIGLLLLVIFGYMNKVSFFFIAGLYFVVQIYYLYQQAVIKKLI